MRKDLEKKMRKELKKRPSKGILIGDQEIEVVNVRITNGSVDLKELRRLVDCSLVDYFSLNDEFDMWLDDIGLFKNGNFMQSYTLEGKLIPQEVPGNVLILARNSIGNPIGLMDKQVDYVLNNLNIVSRKVIDLGDEESDPMDLARKNASKVVGDMRKMFLESGFSEDDIPF